MLPLWVCILLLQGWLHMTLASNVVRDLEMQHVHMAAVAGSNMTVGNFTFEIQSMDGTGNNLQNPAWGSVNSPFIRMVPSAYGPNTSLGGSNRPSARYISQNIFSKKPYLQNTDGISDLLPAWGVMLHLDITVAPRNSGESCDIPVPKNDPIFDPTGTGTQTIPMSRTNYYGVVNNSRIIYNGFTAWLDASGLYGNNMEEMASMRSFTGGLFKSVYDAKNGEFPPRYIGGPLDGHFTFNSDVLNMMPQLTTLYVVFFREHQRRARLLAQRHPDWNDEMIYQRARRWMIAIIQKVTLYFYVPNLIGQQVPPYKGYDPTINPAIDLFFANVAFRYGHSAINSIVTRIDDYGQEIPEGHVVFRDFFYQNNCNEIMAYGIEPILRGFATQHDQVVDTKFVDDIRNYLPLNPGFHYDLAAIGVQRGRELGIPDYNTCRLAFNMTPARTWSDVTSDPTIQSLLAQTYTSIDDSDPYVVAFAEDHVDANSMLGPMMRKSVMDQFLRLRDADRFWYERPGILTDDERRELANYTLGDMIVANTKIKHFPSDPFVAVNISSMFFLYGPQGVLPTTPAPQLTILGKLRLSWSIRSDEQMIDFVFESNATGWFGFGFGVNMLGADIYFCQDMGNGTFTVVDSYSQITQPPQPDTAYGGVNDLVDVHDITSTQSSSVRVVKFSRPLITGDPYDHPIENKVMDLIFAFSDNNNLIWHGPDNRAHGALNMFQTTGTVVLVNSAFQASASLKTLHGVTMYTAFALIYPLGIFVARYYQNLGRWLSIHQALMSMVTSNVLVTAITAIIGNYGDASFLHYKIGLVVVGLVVFTSTLGYVTARVVTPWINHNGKSMRVIHRTLGLSTYVLGALALLFYGEFRDYMEELFPKKDKSMRTRSLSKDAKSEKLPIFSWDDVNQRVSLGAKWLVIDNIIYDVEKFASRHPGGAVSIIQMIGLDATAEFHGSHMPVLRRRSQSLSRNRSLDRSKKGLKDPNYENLNNYHRHSRFANFLLSGLAIGKLRRDEMEDRSTDNVASTINSNRASEVYPPSLMSGDDEEGGKLEPWQKPPITPDRFRTFILSTKKRISQPGSSREIFVLTFNFQKPDEEIRFRPGDSVYFQFVDESGKVVTRSYSPIRSINKGSIDFIVKMYSGEMTSHLMLCKSIRIRGPFPSADVLNPYADNGCWKTLGLICGGTGLTPFLLLIDYYLRNSRRDPVKNRPNFQIHLLNMNNSEMDIFAQQELQELERLACGALSVVHLVQQASQSFSGIVGKISPEVIQATMPRPPLETKKWQFSTAAGTLRKRSFNRRIGSEYMDTESGKDIGLDSSQSDPTRGAASLSITSVMPTLREESTAGTQHRSSVDVDSSRLRLGIPARGTITHSHLMDEYSGGSSNEDEPFLGEGGGSPGGVNEADQSLAMIVCGPNLMNISVGDMLRNMGYPVVVTL
ncbi:hypothetical protein HDU76_000668 [Blyttiomyces sp. JEL0837]|nr:hypothetical protein HDU76_000668 [Blyttiomyces sp. JEL0837]